MIIIMCIYIYIYICAYQQHSLEVEGLDAELEAVPHQEVVVRLTDYIVIYDYIKCVMYGILCMLCDVTCLSICCSMLLYRSRSGCPPVYIYIYIYTHIHKCIYTYTIYIYIYICVCIL